jgi:exoribonuclease-2
LRDNLCRFDALPLVVRVASLPALGSGERVRLDVSAIDLLDLTLHCEFRSTLEPPHSAASTDVTPEQASAAAP